MNALQTTWERLFAQMPSLRGGDTGSRFRPKLHVSPPTGWLNDPNSLCQINGIYHVFYQFSPFDPEGGLKFWGHCTSRDLLHWDFAGVPLLPDQPGDCHGAYSGSALMRRCRRCCRRLICLYRRTWRQRNRRNRYLRPAALPARSGQPLYHVSYFRRCRLCLDLDVWL